jgi:hypothetical protein
MYIMSELAINPAAHQLPLHMMPACCCQLSHDAAISAQLAVLSIHLWLLTERLRQEEEERKRREEEERQRQELLQQLQAAQDERLAAERCGCVHSQHHMHTQQQYITAASRCGRCDACAA